MNKVTLFFLIFVVYSIHGNAQIKYENLDKYSKIISEIQNRAQPVPCAGEQVEFPEESFKFLYSKNTFSYAFFSKLNGYEAVFISDYIDLSDVKEVYFYKSSKCEEVLWIAFAKNLEFQIENRQDGGNGSRITKNLSMYFKNTSEEDKNQLFNNVINLIYHFQINSSPKNKLKLEEEHNALIKAVRMNNYSKYAEFLKTYPKSIVAREVQNRIEKLAINDDQISNFFKSYFTSSNRSKKYLELWGNWKPNHSIKFYTGKSKDLKSEYLKEGYSFSFDFKANKHTYSNSGPFFEYYSYDVDVFDDSKSVEKNTIKIGKKTYLVPSKVGFNDDNQVVYLIYKVRSNKDLPMYELSEFLELGLENDKKSSSGNVEFYQWFFDDCTIVYVAEEIDISSMIGRAKTNPSDFVTVHFHDKKNAVPYNSYKLTTNGKTYEISPALWRKMIEGY